MLKKRIVIIIISIILISSVAVLFSVSSAKKEVFNYAVKTDPLILKAAENVSSQSGLSLYAGYLKSFKDAKLSGESFTVSGSDGVRVSGDVKVEENYKGLTGKILITGEESQVKWEINVTKPGFYKIAVEYYPVEGNSSAAERAFRIDGKLPFDECNSLLFERLWKDKVQITQDETGNDLRPEQIEAPALTTKYVTDSLGYYSEPLSFYLEEGRHTLTFDAIREPLAIQSITFDGKFNNIPSYNEYLSLNKDENNGDKIKNGYLLYEAEKTARKSDPTLYPVSDRSSPATQPQDASKIRLNTIGGDKWKTPGQWIEWEIAAPTSGYYNIGLRSRQNTVRGIYTNRKLTIDGASPFAEAENLTFNYSDNWQVGLLGKETPYRFFLKEGRHLIRLQVTLGDLNTIFNAAQSCLNNLNSAYWSIMSITGSDPDAYRDYKIDVRLPEVITTFREQSKIISAIAKNMEERTGQKGEKTAVLEQLSIQLKRISDDPNLIGSTLSSLKDNIGALGNWLISTREQPLQIDYILLSDDGASLPNAEKGFLENTKFGFLSFFSSFVENYSLMGSKKDDNKKAVTVWIGSGVTGGRDQAQTLKQLIQNDFTPKNNIPINLQLIPPGTILSATLAGKGPDVALQIGGSEPVNYAMRNAVADISKFDDYNEIAKRFYESAITPFKYLDGVYALPETQSFPIMFYRNDILAKLGIDINSLKTWDDILEILPDLQKKHMNFGLPSAALNTSIQNYAMFLYQMDGTFYRNGGIESNLDASISIDAFKKMTDFYSYYRLPVEYSFENRFRVGEIPIGIADYTVYNLLSVSAPEIKGLWGMAPLPGIKSADGTINNLAPSSTSGCILMSASKTKDDAWKFMKWWTDSGIQVQFGKELESIMGTAARYNTANIAALEKLPWPAADRRVLLGQWKNSKGIPEVPGGYYTARYIDFAFREVLNTNSNSRETLLDNVFPINEEINIKRKEFGLDN